MAEHLINNQIIRLKINNKLTPSDRDRDLNFSESISFFEGQKTILENEEESEKVKSLTILHDEERAIEYSGFQISSDKNRDEPERN